MLDADVLILLLYPAVLLLSLCLPLLGLLERRNTQAALCAWMREEGLVLGSASPQVSRIDCLGKPELDRGVLRFDATDRDGRLWRGHAFVGAWDGPAIESIVWDETPTGWGLQPGALRSRPSALLRAVRRVRSAGCLHAFGRRAARADSARPAWDDPAPAEPAECASPLGAVRRLRASGHRRRSA